MFRVVAAESIAPEIRRIEIKAAAIARKHRAGQFVILRVTPTGERIPLTIGAADASAGTITLFVQGVGRTTQLLNLLEAGDFVSDVAGPLGRPSEIERYGHAVVVGGGLGTAIAYPVARALLSAGNDVLAIVGGRTEEYVLLEAELQEAGATVITCTDDGSYGRAGFVTEALLDLIEGDEKVDVVFAAGPVPMMRAVAETTRPHGIPTIASLNPIMVDGTGMCGGCRVDVGGETKFACVDGPEFDAHLVDFDLLDRRNRAYLEFEGGRREDLADLDACRIEELLAPVRGTDAS
jgi:ferredoxin--NADP+ reductase